jgi:hypothetical protein
MNTPVGIIFVAITALSSAKMVLGCQSVYPSVYLPVRKYLRGSYRTDLSVI